MTSSAPSVIGQLLAAENLDALVIFSPVNLRYLCGFTGTDGVLIFLADRSAFLTDSRYVIQAGSQVDSGEIIEYKNKAEGVRDFLLAAGVKRVGFEPEFMTLAQHAQLADLTAGVEWVAVGPPLRKLRSLKSAEEVEKLGAAAQLAADGFNAILPQIRPGKSEAEIALELEYAIRRLGGDERAFEFIVASGPRGALPHGVASKKLLQEGELVTIDYGIRLNGYHSDETVTLALGNIASNLRAIFDIVLDAHDLAIEKVRPGLPLKALDACARDYIAAQGYGDYFGHGLGHGVGLEIHEYPAVSPRAEDLVEEGMVLTIEPGIYLPGVGGVRIEDTVYVTAEGCRILTRLPKHFCNLLA